MKTVESSNICEYDVEGKYFDGKLQTFCLILRITAATLTGEFVSLSLCLQYKTFH